jgi:lipoyl(octanoyl) transferase
MAHALLEGMRRWLRDAHGVESGIPPGRPGLFVDGRKLLSVGISARGGVTMHGIAMNLSNDLTLWNGIVACGEPGTRPVSLSELLGRRVDVSGQKASIATWLTSEWGYAEVEEAPGAPGERGLIS